jgi:hypothetical protein
VAKVAHVINFDMSKVAENFVHRVGRTGRPSAHGVASTFAGPAERGDLRKIERTLSIQMKWFWVRSATDVKAALRRSVHWAALPPNILKYSWSVRELVKQAQKFRFPHPPAPEWRIVLFWWKRLDFFWEQNVIRADSHPVIASPLSVLYVKHALV